jgi:K+-sensing histidine kinase KdpD
VHAEDARQEFLASVTHDIQSPLAVIKGHAAPCATSCSAKLFLRSPPTVAF